MNAPEKAATPVFNAWRTGIVRCARTGGDHEWSYLGATTNPTCRQCHRDFVNLALDTLADRVNRLEQRLGSDNTDSLGAS